MAATSGQAGFGTKLKQGAGGVLTALGEVTGISGPGMDCSSVDLTHNTSPNGFREFVAGLGDGGEVTVELNQVAADIDTIMGLWRTTKQWQIVLPNDDTWNWEGFITGLDNASEMDGKVSVTLTIKVSARPVFGNASSTWSS